MRKQSSINGRIDGDEDDAEEADMLPFFFLSVREPPARNQRC